MLMRGFFTEFKTFAMKGNVVDLAIAVVIGTAFGKIVSSLVDNIITPLLGLFMGGVDVSSLSYTTGETVVSYGLFIQAIIDFLIIALVIFVVVRAINHTRELFDKDEQGSAEGETAPAAPPEEVVLLREIRDSLKQYSR